VLGCFGVQPETEVHVVVRLNGEMVTDANDPRYMGAEQASECGTVLTAIGEGLTWLGNQARAQLGRVY
jgi:hypothetical protein